MEKGILKHKKSNQNSNGEFGTVWYIEKYFENNHTDFYVLHQKSPSMIKFLQKNEGKELEFNYIPNPYSFCPLAKIDTN